MMQKDDEKKQRILEIAKSFFSHFGLKKTTMNEIAHKARMAKSTFVDKARTDFNIFEQNTISKILSDSVDNHMCDLFFLHKTIIFSKLKICE